MSPISIAIGFFAAALALIAIYWAVKWDYHR